MALDVTVPKNAVLAGGQARRRNKKVKTVTNVRPGRVAVYDTTDDEFKVAAAAAKHGILGWVEDNYTNPAWNKTSDPTAGDEFSILYGGGFEVKTTLITGENVTDGDLLVTAADGKVKKAGTLAIAAGATAVTSTAANGASILTGSVPNDGLIVAKAMHDVDATSADKDLVAYSFI